MVMTCRHAPSSARLTLLVLFIITSQLAGTAPVWGDGGEGGVEGRTRTNHKEDSLSPILSLPPLALSTPANTLSDRNQHLRSDPGQSDASDNPADPARILAILLEALEHPRESETEEMGEEGEWGEGQSETPVSEESGQTREVVGKRSVEGGETEKALERLTLDFLAAARSDAEKEKEEEEEEDRSWLAEHVGATADVVSEDGGEEKETGQEEGSDLVRFLDQVRARTRAAAASPDDDRSLQRDARGYFQNIDLGLQDNEILPPLKGYKAYNTQLARAGKKQHWQEEQANNRPIQGGNFMDDFESDGEELQEEAESISRMEEEARARAEKQEVLRQQEEAERAREEEQRLADIASDMLLQYMGRKQQPYMKPRQKSSIGAAGNTAEDKRSEEVVGGGGDDDDDLDQQMIDRLIEISSKLHLPADDVIEIISDVEEKKKKRKELQLQPSKAKTASPRFRPLVAPPLPAPPIYHYTASNNPKKAPYVYKSNKKWLQDKDKSYKQDYWYKPKKQLDYWFKPQKQFLAFPSYPYYQKPYRAYYPVYFPYPKSHFYAKPPPSREQPFGPKDFDFQVPWRRFRPGGKGHGKSWRQQPVAQLPLPPYISNYILPHPRTYQPLPPPPKPIIPARRDRRPPYYYPQITPADDYEEDGLVPQLDSEEELENFIERIYMKRRMY